MVDRERAVMFLTFLSSRPLTKRTPTKSSPRSVGVLVHLGDYLLTT